MERVFSFKFLGTHITEDFTWTTNTTALVKKAQQRLYFLRTLKKTNLSGELLVSFYHCSVESVLTYCITAWYANCSAADRRALQRVINTVQKIIGLPLPSLQDTFREGLSRANSILKDTTHPYQHLFSLLPSGRRYRALKARTSRLKNSFYPRAITELNSIKH